MGRDFAGRLIPHPVKGGSEGLGLRLGVPFAKQETQFSFEDPFAALVVDMGGEHHNTSGAAWAESLDG
jgi:hypothetical protein